MTPRKEIKVLCGEEADSSSDSGVRLHLGGARPTMSLGFEGLERLVSGDLPPRIEDLLVIAAYVLGADCSVERGRPDDVDLGHNWIRSFHFRIPVLDPEFWTQPQVKADLRKTLGELSGEHFDFEFTRQKKPRSKQLGLASASNERWSSWDHIDEIALFSGGLDSFSGAMEEMVGNQKNVALVSLSTASSMVEVQDKLLHHMATRWPDRKVLHVRTRFTRHGRTTDRERTQRTRSFLFTALAGSVAGLMGRDRFRFYENGIASFNLPVSRDVVGSKASRTTHPLVIAGYQRLLSAVLGRRITIESPFLYLSRKDVIERLIPLNAADLIPVTISCAHVIESSTAHPHCGVCSQCVDRRFAIDALGLSCEEDEFTYRRQVFEDAFDDRQDRLYLLDYIAAADKWASCQSPLEFAGSFGEAARAITGAIEGVSLDAAEALRRIYELHHRHGEAVAAVLDTRLGASRRGLEKRKFPPNSLPWLLLQRIVAPESLTTSGSVVAGEGRVFRKHGAFWDIEYAGRSESPVPHCLGMDVVLRLLQNRNHCVNVFDLDSPGYREAARVTSLGPRADKKARDDAERARKKLIQDILEAEEMGHSDEVIDLKAQLEKFEDYKRDTTTSRGRPRLDNEKALQARDRVRSNFKTALKQMAEHYPELVEHLADAVKGINGYNPSYIDAGPPWILE